MTGVSKGCENLRLLFKKNKQWDLRFQGKIFHTLFCMCQRVGRVVCVSILGRSEEQGKKFIKAIAVISYYIFSLLPWRSDFQTLSSQGNPRSLADYTDNSQLGSQ